MELLIWAGLVWLVCTILCFLIQIFWNKGEFDGPMVFFFLTPISVILVLGILQEEICEGVGTLSEKIADKLNDFIRKRRK